jgi:hypothetical protein
MLYTVVGDVLSVMKIQMAEIEEWLYTVVSDAMSTFKS